MTADTEFPLPDPMRIRAAMNGARTVVKILMAHDMETGQRRNAAGETIPAWFIQTVAVTTNGRTVLSAQWGPAVARNPYLQFQFAGAQPGDRIQVTWVDNRGASRTDEATVT